MSLQHEENAFLEDLDRRFHVLNVRIERIIHGRHRDTIEGKARHVTHLCKEFRLDIAHTARISAWTDNWIMNEEDDTDYGRVLPVLQDKSRTIHDKCRQITLITGCR